MSVNLTQFPARSARPQSVTARGDGAPKRLSDDEILALNSGGAEAMEAAAKNGSRGGEEQGDSKESAGNLKSASARENSASAISPEVEAVFETHPELRQAWEDAHAYRTAFASPRAAADARQQLDEMDGLFFSNDPADHAVLAAKVHQLHPESFRRLARAMHERATNLAQSGSNFGTGSFASASTPEGPGTSGAEAVERAGTRSESGSGPQQLSFQFPEPAEASGHQDEVAETAPALEDDKRARVAEDSTTAPQHSSGQASVARAAFFRSTNAATVNQVLRAIETQLNHLLPESIGEGPRKRLTGEIYRELDGAMRANRQLGRQLREAFRSGKGDAAHQQAIVALVTGRAKQALPSIAKRVISEWTHAVVQGNHERLSRHEKASKRVDIAGAGASDGVNRKPRSPRDLNYRRLSDSDILNL